MTGIAGTSPVYVMFDQSKGSLTNRADCAIEQGKNNLVTGLKLAVPAAGVAVAMVKPRLAYKVGGLLGRGISSVLKKFPKIANTKIAQRIMANPTRAGIAGLAAAGGLWVLNTIIKSAYKGGQIDQKYTDSAKIESQTKNVVLAKV